MCAVVNNSIHIKIEVIEFGDAILGNQLRDRGIALAEPSKEFGDAHGCLWLWGLNVCCRNVGKKAGGMSRFNRKALRQAQTDRCIDIKESISVI